MNQETQQIQKKSTPKVKIEKVVLNIGGLDDKLQKGEKLLKLISGMKPVKTKSRKRIPAFGVRPGLEIGCKVTIRKKDHSQLLKRLFAAINNTIREKQIHDNYVSFGIHEYIEIPGIEYQRDIGIMGFDITIVFTKPGKRVTLKKIKKGKFPKRQNVTKEEIIDYLKNNYNLEIKMRRRAK